MQAVQVLSVTHLARTAAICSIHVLQSISNSRNRCMYCKIKLCISRTEVSFPDHPDNGNDPGGWVWTRSLFCFQYRIVSSFHEVRKVNAWWGGRVHPHVQKLL